MPLDYTEIYTSDGQGSPPFSNVGIEWSQLSLEEMLWVALLSQIKAMQVLGPDVFNIFSLYSSF